MFKFTVYYVTDLGRYNYHVVIDAKKSNVMFKFYNGDLYSRNEVIPVRRRGFCMGRRRIVMVLF